MLRKLFKRRAGSDGRDKPPPPRPAAAHAEKPREAQTISPESRLLGLPAAEAAAQIEAIEDPDRLIVLALKARGERRDLVLAHPLLQTAAALAALEKGSRDRDKSLNRYARGRLDHYRTLQRDAATERARAEELAAALTRSAPGSEGAAGRERLRQLHQRLNAALDGYQRCREALVAFGDSLTDLNGLRPDPAELAASEVPADQPDDAPHPTADTAQTATADEKPATAAAEAASGEDPFEPLVAQLQVLDRGLGTGEPFVSLAAAREILTRSWLVAADGQPPTAAQHAVFEAVSRRFRQLADAVERLSTTEIPALPTEPLVLPDSADAPAPWADIEERRRLESRLAKAIRTVRWPEWAPPSPEYAALLTGRERLQEELARTETLQQTVTDRLQAELKALAEAIDAGALTTARTLLTQIRGLHDSLPPAAARDPGKRLNHLAARLAELMDWQTFATAPKREALVQAMKTLAEAPLEPPVQAERIKALRAEWQALGPITKAADGRLADQFNAAATIAFDSCRPWFAEQAELRKTNLTERRSICDQLERYLNDADWKQVDVRAADQIMRTAREAWRSFQPVDRSKGKAVEQRFEALQAELHKRIRAQWDRNLHAKEAIVAEAQRLAADDLPLEGKTAAARDLQNRWRAVGPTPRNPDQRLWQAFREACDQIFSVRDQARQEASNAVAAAEERCRELLEQFEDRVERLDPERASEAELRDFRAAAADIDELPQNRRRDLAARRTELINRYRSLLQARTELAERARFLAFKHWDEAMSLAERGVGEAPDGDPVPAAVRSARLQSRDGSTPLDALRRLTVRAELIAGLESPAEDEPLRLEVQVERLQAGLTGGGADEQPGALAEAWCRLGPKGADAAALRERFFAALLPRS